MPATKKKAPQKPPPAAKPADPPKAAAAFAAIQPEMAKLAPDDLGKNALHPRL